MEATTPAARSIAIAAGRLAWFAALADDHAPFVLATPSPTGRPTTEVWAPLEGRYYNAGVRLGSDQDAALISDFP